MLHRLSLKHILLLDASTTCVFALLLVFLPNPIADWISFEPVWLLRSIGLVLVSYCLLLDIGVLREKRRWQIGWAAVSLNLGWVIATTSALITDVFTLNSAGFWLVLLINDLVLVYAALQYWQLRQQRLVVMT